MTKEKENSAYFNKLLDETKNCIHENIIFPGCRCDNDLSIKSTKYKKKYPILLIPSIGDSKLYAKWDLKNIPFKNINIKQKNWFNIWLNISLMDSSFPNSNFLKYILTEFYQKHNNKIKITAWRKNNYKKKKFIPSSDFGGLEGLGVFDNNSLNTFLKLVSFLKSDSKYTQGKNLFAGTYDFFRIMEPKYLQIYFKMMKDLIEYSYRKNKRSIILFSHGFGANLILLFLNYYLPKKLKQNSQEWKSKYIKSFIMVNSMLGGCPLSLKTILSGENRGLGIFSATSIQNKWYKDIEEMVHSLHYSIPNISIFDNFKFLKIDNINYNIIDFMKKKIPNYYNILKIQKYFLFPPKVPIFSICSSTLKGTSIRYQYKNLEENPKIINEQSWYNNLDQNSENQIFKILKDNTSTKYMKGDGIIPFISQQVPLLWKEDSLLPNSANGLYYKVVTCRIQQKKCTHKNILSQKIFLQELTNILKNLNQ